MDLRTGIALLLSLVLSAALYPYYIEYAKKVQFGQQIREDGPQSHLSKAGTPTMGGVVFLAAATVALFLAKPSMGSLLLPAIFVTLGNGFIGFLDDYGMVLRKASLGLKARNKLFGQVLIAFLLGIFLYRTGHPAYLEIPFSGVSIDVGWAFYPVLLFLIILGTTNAVNLTDGVDGLAAGASVIALISFMVIGYVKEMTDIVIFCGTMTAAILGFLLYNKNPARIFMGDTGSLALGGALAAMAILTKTELYLLIIGAVFVVETLSVILQVASFKLTGKRIFLMSPLHHHFELKGWSEWKVVTAFWCVALFFGIIGVADIFLRL